MMSVAVDDTPHSTSSHSSEFSASTTLRLSGHEGGLPEDPVQGWPQLALLMAKTPDFAAL